MFVIVAMRVYFAFESRVSIPNKESSIMCDSKIRYVIIQLLFWFVMSWKKNNKGIEFKEKTNTENFTIITDLLLV